MGIKADQMCLAIARVLENEKDQYLYFAPYGNDVWLTAFAFMTEIEVWPTGLMLE